MANLKPVLFGGLCPGSGGADACKSVVDLFRRRLPEAVLKEGATAGR
jgi:hypothetical protein